MTSSAGMIVAGLALLLVGSGHSLLQPRESESREIKDLSGMWDFMADMSPNRSVGFDDRWYSRPLKKVRN